MTARAALVAAAALVCALAASWTPPAQAAISKTCTDLRDKITKMEDQVPSGAALSVDLAIRRVYVNDCLRHPSDGQTPGSAASDPWFNAKGDPASGPPPQGDGAYQTTAEIAGYCRGSSDPQLCVLMLNLGEGEMLAEGGDPQNPEDWQTPERAIDPADELPPLRLSAGGQTYSVDDACLGGLAAVLFSSPNGTSLRGRLARNAATPECAAELDALNSGLAALQDAIAHWRAAALADQTTPTRDPRTGYVPKSPGFVEMCTQAFNNQNTCLKRQANMGTAGTGIVGGSDGQAGSFGECASLYGSVVALCEQSGFQYPKQSLREAMRPTNPAPAPSDKTGGSSPPPKPAGAGPGQTPAQAMAGQMPASCAPEMQKYLDDVGSKQSVGAVSSYQQLASSGECRDAMQRIADENSLALPERNLTPLTRNAFGAAFAKDPNAPLAAPTPGYAGSSGGGDDVDPEQVLEFGMALLNLGIGAANLANAMHGGGVAFPTTNFNSLAGPIIHSAPGQGAPTYRPPSNNNSTITGTH